MYDKDVMVKTNRKLGAIVMMWKKRCFVVRSRSHSDTGQYRINEIPCAIMYDIYEKDVM